MTLLPLALIPALQAAPDLDAAVKHLYDVISGPAGHKRDWDAFRAMFAEGAQMRSIGKRDGKTVISLLTPEDYATKAGPNLEANGFFEKEISRKAWAYGDMVQLFSTYESRRKADDEKPFDRGINTITLVKQDDKWKIASISWTSERVAGPIPAGFLSGG